MQLAVIDVIIIIVYFLLILFIGFYLAPAKSSKGNVEEFLLAGRKITLPLFVATLVATWYGNILGVGEFVFKSGISAWVCFGLPYYIAALLFALYLSKKIRLSKTRTIPEQINSRFGKLPSLFASLVVLLITTPAAYILMLGVMINLFTGWDLWLSIILGTAISIIFLFTGGFKADVLTNSAQFVLMYIGFFVLLFFAVANYGFTLEFFSFLPENHIKFFGGFSWQYILSWYIISFQTFVDPSFHQRCAAAASDKVARNGILVSILFWMIFDFLTLSTALYAKAFIAIDNPLLAYPIMGDLILPAFWKGIFVVALLATIMSTLDSYAFISAATIGYDIISPVKHKLRLLKRISDDNAIKFGLALTGVFGIFVALIIPSAIDIVFKTASIAVPGLLIPLILSYSQKFVISQRKVIYLILIPVILSFIWTLGKEAELSNLIQSIIFTNFEPMIIGIFSSLVLSALFIKKNEN